MTSVTKSLLRLRTIRSIVQMNVADLQQTREPWSVTMSVGLLNLDLFGIVRYAKQN